VKKGMQLCSVVLVIVALAVFMPAAIYAGKMTTTKTMVTDVRLEGHTVIYITPQGEFLSDTDDAPGGKQWSNKKLKQLGKIHEIMEMSFKNKKMVIIKHKDNEIIDVNLAN